MPIRSFTRSLCVFKVPLLFAAMAFTWLSLSAAPVAVAGEPHHMSAAYGKEGVTPAFIPRGALGAVPA